MKSKVKLPEIGPRARLALKITGYILLGLVSLIYAFHLTFPYDRVKDRAVDWLSTRYDVSVGGVERGMLPGDFSLRLVTLRTRPTKPGEPVKTIVIDRLDIDIGVISSLFNLALDVELDAKVGPGRISGNVVVSKGRFQADLASSNLPLSDVPGLASIIGMPMDGPGNVQFRLDLPGNDWRKASARLAVGCVGCTVGGEGAFFKPRTTSRTEGFVKDGVPVPKMRIDRLDAAWVIEKGNIRQERYVFSSPHLLAELDFGATVEKNIKDSRIDDACLQYRGTEELKKLDPDFYAALELTGGPLGPDDLRHLKLVGTLAKFRALGKLCGGGDAGDDRDVADPSPGVRTRPNLGNVPDPSGAAPTTGGDDPASRGLTPTNPPDPEPPDSAGTENPKIELTPKIDDVRPGPPENDPAPDNDRDGPTTGDGAAPSGEAPPSPSPSPDPAASVRTADDQPTEQPAEPVGDDTTAQPPPENE